MDINVIMIDDHLPIIEGYKSMLSYNTAGYKLNTIMAIDCETGYKAISNSNYTNSIDVVFVDIALPAFAEKNINSGEELVPIIKKFLPQAKIVILTSHTESFVLCRIIKELNPNGIIVKNDITANDFIVGFEAIMKGENYYSKTVLKSQKEITASKKTLDSYNQQVITLLVQGVKNKNIQEQLQLSRSAIDKRKVAIKEFFGIDKGTDEDIIKAARNHNLI
ncbi:hypothetical protein [Flavobacterium sp.]|uniref:hypothetical protein n=1 Tax=Flavobacterium sp. TaxID=239 RepID=UPI0037505483